MPDVATMPPWFCRHAIAMLDSYFFLPFRLPIAPRLPTLLHTVYAAIRARCHGFAAFRVDGVVATPAPLPATPLRRHLMLTPHCCCHAAATMLIPYAPPPWRMPSVTARSLCHVDY